MSLRGVKARIQDAVTLFSGASGDKPCWWRIRAARRLVLSFKGRTRGRDCSIPDLRPTIFAMKAWRCLVLLFLFPIVLNASGAGFVSAQPHTFVELTKIEALDSRGRDLFGYSVAADANLVVIGSIYHPGFDGGGRLGSAYVYEWNGTVFQASVLAPFSPTDGGIFGAAVSVADDLIVVSAPEDDDLGESSGSASVFSREGGVWSRIQKLLPTDGMSGDRFGHCVATDGSTIVVGAPHAGRGAAYVFQQENGLYRQIQVLRGKESSVSTRFGGAVAIQGQLLVVGSRGEVAVSGSSSANVFRTDGSDLFAFEQELLPSDPEGSEAFGDAVGLDDDAILVGAPGSLNNRGRAYVFRFEGGHWSEEQVLNAGEGSAGGDSFGRTLDIRGDAAIVGMELADDAGMNSGAAVVFRYRGGHWARSERLRASDEGAEDRFGFSVALSNQFAAIGSPNEDRPGQDSGAAYVFAGADPEVCLQGTVNAAAGAIRDVLFLNGGSGSATGRRVYYDVLSPFDLSMIRPPSVQGPSLAPFAVYAWPGRPSRRTSSTLPFGLGCSAFPMPLSGGNPQPVAIWNNAGRPDHLGIPTGTSLSAPSTFLYRKTGLARVGVFCIQGVIFDPGSLAEIPASLTNGIVAIPVVSQ